MQSQALNASVDKVLREEHHAPPRVLWEVYTGRARLSQVAELPAVVHGPARRTSQRPRNRGKRFFEVFENGAIALMHLQFHCKRVYLKQWQVNSGRHSHIEQPTSALSWETSAFQSLPGYRARHHQCQYGAVCMDTDDQ